jgi:septal ring factor EnvC (AmiA/AmiB activator)
MKTSKLLIFILSVILLIFVIKLMRGGRRREGFAAGGSDFGDDFDLEIIGENLKIVATAQEAATVKIANIEQLLIGTFKSESYTDNNKIGVEGWLTDNGADCNGDWRQKTGCGSPNKTFMGEITALDVKVTAAEANATTVAATVATTDIKASKNTSEIGSINSKFRKNDSDISTIRKNIGKNTSEISNHRYKIANNERTLKTNIYNIQKNTDTITEAAAKASANATNITNLVARVTELEGKKSASSDHTHSSDKIDDINEWTENHKGHHDEQKTEYDSHINAFQTLQALSSNDDQALKTHLTQYVGHIKNFQTLQTSTENIDKNLKDWQTSFNKAKGELNVNIKCQEDGTGKWGEEPGQYCPEWLKPKD